MHHVKHGHFIYFSTMKPNSPGILKLLLIKADISMYIHVHEHTHTYVCMYTQHRFT